jgi:hypothetical protein
MSNICRTSAAVGMSEPIVGLPLGEIIGRPIVEVVGEAARVGDPTNDAGYA